MRLLVQPRGTRLTGDCYQRGVVHISISDAGDQIGRPRTEGGETDTGTATESSPEIGHEGRALFVSGGDELDLRIEQRIHDIEVLFARNTEDVLNTLVLQALHHQLRCLHQPHPRW